MAMEYVWANIAEFRNRVEDLRRLEDWWESANQTLSLFGRRRVGKSWLFRAFAHEKPAMIFVADSVAEAPQLERFADILEAEFPVRPSLPNLPAFFRALFRLAADERRLVVIDEFPYLLPAREKNRKDLLQALQAVLEEEEGSSHLKLLLCGSHVAMMERLVLEASPFHGRLLGLSLEPLSFWQATPFLEELAGDDMIERFAVAGGMPLYLRELGTGTLEERVIGSTLNQRAPLFDEPRTVLTQELREPRIYFSILEQLASGEKPLSEVAGALRTDTASLTEYVDNLQNLRIVERRLPVTASPGARDSHYRLRDPFVRFWFRFVFPCQADLMAGLDPNGHYKGAIQPHLPDHVAPVFEELCRAWARSHYAEHAQRFGPWWGNALNELRMKGERFTEEIDLVGLAGRRASVVGESRWRTGPMGSDVLDSLDRFKLPALRQEGIKIAKDLQILLFSRGGFDPGLEGEAARRGTVRLVGTEELAAG